MVIDGCIMGSCMVVIRIFPLQNLCTVVIRIFPLQNLITCTFKEKLSSIIASVPI